mgnify:CR=1 FL=1
MPASLKVSRVGSLDTSGLPQITLTVTEAVSLPTNIFLYKIDDRGESYDTFVSVCNIEDLETYPDTRVGVGKGNLYRKSSALVSFSSMNKASKANHIIDYALRDLVQQYNSVLEVSSLDDVLEIP